MAGFSVANFDFGKNIVDAEIRRQQIAAGERASQRNADLQRRQQDLQLRQQDLNAQQQQAQLAEGARQFDERMGEAAATRAEGARQFDERMGEAAAQRAEGARQFDETTGLKKQQLSWDEALKQQQLDESNMKMQKWAAEMDEFLAKGRRDREEYEQRMADQQAIRNSFIGKVAQGVLLSGSMGGLTPSQTASINEEFGTDYDCIGKRDMLTGEMFDDGMIRMVKYHRDENGKVIYGHTDQNTGKVVVDGTEPVEGSRPLTAREDVFTKEDFEAGISPLSGYAKLLKNGNGGMSPERIELENAKLKQREKEEEGRNARAEGKVNSQRARIAASVAKQMGDISRGLNIDEGQQKLLAEGLTNMLFDLIGNNGCEPGKEQVKTGDNNPAGEKKVRGYRYNKDRSKRIPVYEDGSQGAVEDIK